MPELLNQSQIKKQLLPTLQALLDGALDASAKSGSPLRCAAIFGSAASRDFSPARSDINLFFVFDTVNADLLRELKPLFSKHIKKIKTTPIIADSKWVSASLASFPLEFLEWKEDSIVIYGENPLAGAEVPLTGMKTLVEQALRGKRLRLAQAYLEMPPGRGRVQALLMSAVPGISTMCRGILRLQGASALPEELSMLGALERKSGIQLATLKRLLRLRGENINAGTRECEIMLKELSAELDALADYAASIDSI